MVMQYSIERSHKRRNGRIPPHTVIHPHLGDRQDPQHANKKGTIDLSHEAYALADNDLPGIIPLHLNENLLATAQQAVGQTDMTALVQAALNQLHSYP